jgi:tetratricopeptide (TPR) repeat protein
VAYSKLKMMNESLQDLNSALTINGEYVKALLKRGEIHMSMGNYEEAVRDYSQAKTLDPCKYNWYCL